MTVEQIGGELELSVNFKLHDILFYWFHGESVLKMEDIPLVPLILKSEYFIISISIL